MIILKVNKCVHILERWNATMMMADGFLVLWRAWWPRFIDFGHGRLFVAGLVDSFAVLDAARWYLGGS